MTSEYRTSGSPHTREIVRGMRLYGPVTEARPIKCQISSVGKIKFSSVIRKSHATKCPFWFTPSETPTDRVSIPLGVVAPHVVAWPHVLLLSGAGRGLFVQVYSKL